MSQGGGIAAGLSDDIVRTGGGPARDACDWSDGTPCVGSFFAWEEVPAEQLGGDPGDWLVAHVCERHCK